MNPDQLQDNLPIRDIHLPEPVSWWPPGPGWWALLGLAIVGALYLYWLRRKARQSQTSPAVDYRRLARAELQALRNEYQRSGDKTQLAISASALLRRLLIQERGQDIAGLTGPAWLALLDEHFGPTAASKAGLSFTQAEYLLAAPYSPTLNYGSEQLLSLLETALLESQPSSPNNKDEEVANA